MIIAYYIVFTLMYLLSLLPLWVLYRLSDAMYYIVYYGARYRRGIVRKNLTDSFPDKTAKDIASIEKDFYSWFCDYIVETIKLFTMSKRQMKKRMRFEGVDAVKHYFDNNVPCSVYLGHYCNWEWITSLPLSVNNGICAQIYHPIENKYFNSLFLRLRNRFGAVSIEMDSSFRTILSWKKQNTPNVVGYIADQVPGLHNVHCWVDFLNHDTPVFTGAEKITMITGAKVFYADVTRPKRGYYVASFKEISVEKEDYEKFFYTKKYFELLEHSICKHPQYWLWSHNRWKRTRQQFNCEYTEEERKRMLSRL